MPEACFLRYSTRRRSRQFSTIPSITAIIAGTVLAGRAPAGTRAVTNGMTAWYGAAPMAGTAGAAATGSGRMVPMESAFGITALRPMFLAAARPYPLASQASLQRRQVSWAAAFRISMALALPHRHASRAAALWVSMALPASLQRRHVSWAAALWVSMTLAASLQRRHVSWAAALWVSMALMASLQRRQVSWAATLRVSMALAARLRPSTALAAGRRLSRVLSAALRLSTALPPVGDFTAAGVAGRSRSADTVALGIDELGPKIRLEPHHGACPVTPGRMRKAGAGGRKTEEDTVAKLALTAVIFTALMTGVATGAQNDRGYVAPELSKPAPGHLLGKDYLTSTGETVPRPGLPQSSGETPFDRFIEQQDDRIDSSICKGC